MDKKADLLPGVTNHLKDLPNRLLLEQKFFSELGVLHRQPIIANGEDEPIPDRVTNLRRVFAELQINIIDGAPMGDLVELLWDSGTRATAVWGSRITDQWVIENVLGHERKTH